MCCCVEKGNMLGTEEGLKVKGYLSNLILKKEKGRVVTKKEVNIIITY